MPSSRGQHHSGGQASPFQRLAGQLDRRTRSFRQALAVPQGQAEGPEVSGFELASFLALRFIPAAGSLGRWDLAAGEAARCLRLLAAGQAVAGAPAYLPLLAVPVLWSLSFTYPDLQEGGALPAARADRLRRAWSITELFQALGPPANAPPSVSFAAGALAAVLGAPSAGAWVEEGHRRAQEHGAWGFAHFFAPLVTAQGLDPSGE